MTIFWGLAGVCQPPSTFWSVTLQPMGTDQATIQHLKGDIPSFHMRYRGLISIHRLQRKMIFCPLSFFSLVPIPTGDLNVLQLVHNQLFQVQLLLHVSSTPISSFGNETTEGDGIKQVYFDLALPTHHSVLGTHPKQQYHTLLKGRRLEICGRREEGFLL